MAEEMTPADLLEKGADLLEVHGWGQGLYMDKEGRMCAVGALRRADSVASNNGANRTDAYYGARSALNRATEAASGHSVTEWNDVEGRTAGEVIDLLKHTAKDLRNKATAA